MSVYGVVVEGKVEDRRAAAVRIVMGIVQRLENL
jgi:hypothetical protein